MAITKADIAIRRVDDARIAIDEIKARVDNEIIPMIEEIGRKTSESLEKQNKILEEQRKIIGGISERLGNQEIAIHEQKMDLTQLTTELDEHKGDNLHIIANLQSSVSDVIDGVKKNQASIDSLTRSIPIAEISSLSKTVERLIVVIDGDANTDTIGIRNSQKRIMDSVRDLLTERNKIRWVLIGFILALTLQTGATIKVLQDVTQLLSHIAVP